jgi:hypothetical protein
VAVQAFISELLTDPAAEWERRLLALDTEVHRVKRDRKIRAVAAHGADRPRGRGKEGTG